MTPAGQMRKRGSTAALDARDIAAEIVRPATASQNRAPGPDGATARIYVIRLSDPPTASERLQLAAARQMSWPVAIMPARCRTMDEWLARYAPSDDPRENRRPAA